METLQQTGSLDFGQHGLAYIQQVRWVVHSKPLIAADLCVCVCVVSASPLFSAWYLREFLPFLHWFAKCGLRRKFSNALVNADW